jgi:hypothetical protein
VAGHKRLELVAVSLVAGVAVAAVALSASHDRARTRARADLFAEIQPVAITNCRLERIGSPNDGGYLACANLLDRPQVGYSYGISGTDDWGCSITSRLHIAVHEYDCFDLRRPSCDAGTLIFHPECIGSSAATEGGRPYDTFLAQFTRNGDLGKRLIVKTDVEGSEWGAFLASPDSVFEQIDQLIVEFHQSDDDPVEYLRAMRRLKQFFVVAHVHYNNFSCRTDIPPFPAWAFEALLVNRRLVSTDGSPAPPAAAGLSSPNDPNARDCQS